jgi:dethiobiotin synthase
MARGLFVTGTDTNVGKTAVAAALMHRYRDRVPLRYWKPIQTGIEVDDDTATVVRLGRCRDAEVIHDGVRLAKPVSPHLAASWSGVTIAIDPLVAIRHAAPPEPAWIVEGAGGVLVPINDREMIVDVIAALELAALVVARTALGTINHTLLTIEALRRRGLPIAGIVLVGPPDAGAREAIIALGKVAVLGDMPHFTPLSADALAAWTPSFDPAGHLLTCLE